MEKNDRIYIAGHKGLVGLAITKNLEGKGFTNLIRKTHDELDLTVQTDVERFFLENEPEYVFLAAAKVGGIQANNSSPAEFYYINSMIQNNVIHNAYKYNVKKLLFLGSSCIYPKMSPQPIKEEYLLSDYLEPTNEAYAIAKISGLKMCQYYKKQYNANFISCMPTNLYGPNDNFDPESAHVLPALIRKIHEAKMKRNPVVAIWGTGTPKREFLHVDDMADACVFLMQNYDGVDHVNIGSGEEISISDLAELVKEIVGFKGDIVFDTSRPDGTPRKLLDTKKLELLGWKSRIHLAEGIKDTYELYKKIIK